MRDLRFALRQLARSGGFTATAVVTLALGIGACVAIFSAVDGVLLRPLPYPGSDRLVAIHETLLPPFPEFAVSPRHYLAWREQATSFDGLAAWHEGSYNLTGLGDPIRVSAGRVTASLFSTLQVRPALGRALSAAEDRPGGAPVVVLGHGFWQRQLGGRPDILHQSVTLDGQPFAIVGVMPPGFQLDRPLDVFTPAAYPPSDVHDIAAIGRLRPGVTLAQASSEMSLIARRLDARAEGGMAWGTRLAPLLGRRVGEVRPMLLSLLGAVGFLLLIACANVANLLLARATVRSRELAVRAALGAGRGRIVRGLLTESLLLAGAGGLLGLLLAKVGLRALLSLAPDALPRAAEVAVDSRAVGFALALALVTGIGFGLAPALRASRLDLAEVLKQGGGRGASEGSRQRRLRSALVVAEVAIALVLLAGGGLLIRSFAALQRVSPGWEPRGLLAVTLSLPQGRYPAGGQQAAFAARVVERLAAAPGVQAVGAAQGSPFEGITNHVFFFSIAGRPPAAQRPTASGFSVTGDFFRAMGLPLLRGRLFDARDEAGSAKVTIINQSLARTHFAGLDPIGQRIAARPGQWFEIVGVVADAKYDRRDGGPALQAYAPFAQAPADWGALTFAVRGGPGIEAAVRAAIHAVDPGQAITSLRPASAWIAASLARQRFTMVLFAAFAAAALLLAAVGIYGLLAYTVSRRTAEIGIRLALGARSADVLALVFGQAGRLVGLGLLAGLAGALATTRLLASLLFGVTPHDPLTFAAIALLICLVAALACLLPARRATRVDPMAALRAE